MRTLFLSSGGVQFPVIKEEFVNILPKPPHDIKLAYITTASNVKQNKGYVEMERNILRGLGIQVEDLDIAGKTKEELYASLQDKDVVYVQGGDTFYLLSKVWESHFDEVIKELIPNGLQYVGVSAGTYICCPTIEMATWKRPDYNLYGLAGLKGMSLVPFLISVHYDPTQYKDAFKAGVASTKLPVKILTDDQALVIKNGEVKLVGKGNEILSESL